MSGIEIRKINLIDTDTDVIVNAANQALAAGGGVCGAIFAAAGAGPLSKACSRIGHCPVGSAVITPGFDLKAKAIIHAVGPQWMGGSEHEPELLYRAYRSALLLAEENGFASIGFPLISAGIFGYPLEEAWQVALRACADYLEGGGELEIVFAVLDERILRIGKRIQEKIAPETKGFDRLLLAGMEKPAVFFHLPDEPFGYLSNWHPAPFELEGRSFCCSEQYLMYKKCQIFADQASAEAVMATENPGEHQKIGHQAANYKDEVWAGQRQLIALRGLLAKFSQNPGLKKRLLATGDAVLVECAHQDLVWSCGFRLWEKEKALADGWRGQNLLGFTLMEVRRRLKGEEK